MKPAVFLALSLLVLYPGCVIGGNATQRAVIRAKDKVAPALVHVKPVKEVFRRGRRREVPVIGSGFLISSDGYIVTNEHVAGKSKYVRCVLSNKDEVEAQVVGVDPFTDIAVLKLITDRTDLPYVKLGDARSVVAGQTVIALGSPHGLARSVSSGIVSVTNRNLELMGSGGAPYNNWIQTDAAINQGNSGGPLVNLKGEVIGINTRKLSGAENVGFAIPIDIAAEVIEQLIAHGRVTRSTIGVRFQEVTRITDDPNQEGVLISDVDPLSPAFEARLRPRDILVAVNGTPTDARFPEDLPPIRKLIADADVGEQLTLTILRDGQLLEVSVRTVERSQLAGDEIEFEEWGFTASELTPLIVRRAQLNSSDGIMVSGTQPGGVASNGRLQRGDIILSVDDRKVEGLVSFKEMYDSLVEDRQPLTLLSVKRGALTRFVLIKYENEAGEEGGSNRAN